MATLLDRRKKALEKLLAELGVTTYFFALRDPDDCGYIWGSAGSCLWRIGALTVALDKDRQNMADMDAAHDDDAEEAK